MRLCAALLVTLVLAGCGDDAPPRPEAAPTAPAAEATRAPAATSAPTPRRPRAALGAADVRDFGDFAAGLGGEVGVAVGPPGAAEPVVAGTLLDGSAWSTIKVPIALRVLEQAGGPEGLSPEQVDLMTRAITLSDNDAAAALWEPLGTDDQARAAAVGAVLRSAGDETTQVSAVGRDGFSPFGQTDWALDAQYGLMARLAGGCLPHPADSRYVLDLMGRIASDQTWGLGTTGPAARYKGGWGPGEDGRYLVRQMGVFEVKGRPVVAAIAARPDDGAFETGTRMLGELALWLTQHAAPLDSPGC